MELKALLLSSKFVADVLSAAARAQVPQHFREAGREMPHTELTCDPGKDVR